MIRLLILMCFVTLPFHVSSAVSETEIPDSITLNAKMGPVTFPHSRHIEELKVDCAHCHHDMTDSKKPASCHACHGVSEEAPRPMKAFHALCKECHTEKNDGEGKNAPTQCKACHKKED